MLSFLQMRNCVTFHNLQHYLKQKRFQVETQVEQVEH